MRYNISTKDCKLPERTPELIDRHISKLTKLLPTLSPDFQIYIVIRENRKRKSSLPVMASEGKRNRNSKVRSTRKLESTIYYDGTIKFVLPKKPLVVNLYAINIDKALNEGFEHLFREVKKYKGMHFTSESDYHDKSTIRVNESL